MELQVERLCKSYVYSRALKEVSFHIKEGMYGLLGKNGAGKTTLMKILAGILEKGSGEIYFDGSEVKDINEIRHRIGYIPQKFSFYPNMTVFEIMDYFSVLNKVKKDKKGKIEKLLDLVHLVGQEHTKTKNLSGEMKQRLGIAVSLIGDPDLLLVDEPTMELDPMERTNLGNVLASLAKNRTILLSSHIVSDFETTCKRLIVLDEGEAVFAGSKDELMERCRRNVWEIRVAEHELIKYENEYLISKKELFEEGFLLRIVSVEKPMGMAYEVSPTLNDAYMYLVR
ncbi:ABC transporter, ATP-binding protein [Catonella morbi ATCC 51271]|uniref:ABC transporter, ATP-binding protein n=1 Tax=Catonella morbi ATCC 51271 TaxID=592026 RepID=V2XL68_9FIRM|nr:ATP-binding cassette domain-containing protein [Catonella morbi]ESL02924.1 ABC transporter, ATP-binding protein [Catonella morbi ATCC 51271]